jgi:heat shock protein 4
VPKTSDPVLITHDITKKRETLDRVCKPIVNRPPVKAEPPKPAPEPEPAPEGPAPMEAEAEPETMDI